MREGSFGAPKGSHLKGDGHKSFDQSDIFAGQREATPLLKTSSKSFVPKHKKRASLSKMVNPEGH